MEQIVKKNLQPTFAKMYVLDKSRTEGISVALEYSETSPNFEPLVRICNKDGTEIKIQLDKWIQLKGLFKYIDKYFHGKRDNLRDAEYHGSSWRFKFTYSQ